MAAGERTGLIAEIGEQCDRLGDRFGTMIGKWSGDHLVVLLAEGRHADASLDFAITVSASAIMPSVTPPRQVPLHEVRPRRTECGSLARIATSTQNQ
jgi:hypothetical protein